MLKKLLGDLALMLKDKRVISQIWSDYETVDNEVFSHLHVKFNMEDDQVTIQTAAKDVNGAPVKKASKGILPKPAPPQPINVQHFEIAGEYDISMRAPPTP